MNKVIGLAKEFKKEIAVVAVGVLTIGVIERVVHYSRKRDLTDSFEETQTEEVTLMDEEEGL